MNFQKSDIIPPAEALVYQKKSHFARFMIAYWFVFRWAIRLLWHYKVYAGLFDKGKSLDKEEKLYTKLSLQTKVLFLKLGGVYIKAGQFLSNLAHIFPPQFIENLKDLQDRVPARSFPVMRERFFHEFGKNIEEVFPDIDQTPLASASTAQVHKATLDGRKVAVKILYPGIEQLVHKDLKTIYFLMKWINRYFFTFEYVKIHTEVKDMVLREMDLKKEGESISKMASFFRGQRDYVFPMVYDTHTRRGVLVTKFIEGVKITEVKQPPGGKKSRPLDLLMRAYIQMIFKFHFFHADPHPGNVLYTPQGKLCFLDFGAVGEVPSTISQSLKKIIISSTKKDYYSLIEAMGEMGFFDSSVNREKMEQVAEYTLTRLNNFITNTDYFQNIGFDQLDSEDISLFLKGINTSLRDLMKIMQIPNNYVMLERVFGILVGTAAILDPYRTVLEYSQPHFYELVEDKKDVWDTLEKEGSEIALAGLSIPIEFQKALINLNRGRIRVINKELEKHTDKMFLLGHTAIYAFLTVSFIYIANQYSIQGQTSQSAISYTASAIFGISFLKKILYGK